ncbi:hypothetical protein HDU67_000262, partial [Dinochytrium kinnereticum]
MKSLLTHTWETHPHLPTELTRISTFLDQKARLYGDIMDPSGGGWARMGFPVDEGLTVTSDYTTYTRRPIPPKMDDLAITLTTLHLEWTSLALRPPAGGGHHRPPPPLAKVAALVEDAVRAVEALKGIRCGAGGGGGGGGGGGV